MAQANSARQVETALLLGRCDSLNGQLSRDRAIPGFDRDQAALTHYGEHAGHVEGNVNRHLDLMLHNEQCDPANTPPIVYVDRMAMMTDEAKCSKEKAAVDEHCGNPPDKEKLAKGE